MSKEADMKEVELNEPEQEKQSMNIDTEKNGCVKLKVPEEKEVKFTGLTKEELMRVAGTTGWVRTRWLLLVLFWLGWIGMLAGAVVIIVQAPRCKPIPEMHWWDEGLLYKIADVKGYSDNIKGLESKLDSLNQLKVKGLILGPIHNVQADQLSTLQLDDIDPTVGEQKDLESLLERAHKKSMSIVLDLTPNYKGVNAWFSNPNAVTETLKLACEYWLKKGVDGFFLSDMSQIVNAPNWQSVIDVVHSNATDETKKRALIGEDTTLSVDNVHPLVKPSGVDLLLYTLPDAPAGVQLAINKLYSSNSSFAFSLSKHTSNLPARLYHMLLFTLPGTPVFNGGDEVGLRDWESLSGIWDLENSAEENNETAKTVRAERSAVRSFFKTLSDLRAKERALLHGEYTSLYNSTSSFAFLRLWDQSERFITALNWGDSPATMKLTNSDLPAEARVRLSTDTEKLAVDHMVPLDNLQLGAKQAVLLSYPYAG
ncbi:amino acid transporter heavy chain SLC3A2-like [Clarias gariepinus]|uniref:4F2 cell-surface antigen heavy chain-like n=1 Tax=Clarias gariepinus TaxID=13013 RepID=UPI00234D250F|nr:4F2 cell-surface antigen heavy chain-like [Clarias gariepinus]